MRAFAAALREDDGAGAPERDAIESDLPAELAAALQRAATALAGAGEPDEDARRLAEELAESQRLQDRLARIEQQLADASSSGGRSGAQPEGQQAGLGAGLGDLGELADLLEQLGEGRPELARDLERWARDWRSGAAPGTEAYKQDFSAWPALYGELRYVLEALEASRSRALAADEIADRLQAGAGAATPESYRRLVDRYYRSLAARPTPN